jgi:glutamine synthetase
MLSAAYGCSEPLSAHRLCGYTCGMTTFPQNADDVRQIVEDGGIEFLFAQFVDMHGKPSAKLVPAHHLDDLLTESAGFAGFVAGDIGQGPHDHDLCSIATWSKRSLSNAG